MSAVNDPGPPAVQPEKALTLVPAALMSRPPLADARAQGRRLHRRLCYEIGFPGDVSCVPFSPLRSNSSHRSGRFSATRTTNAYLTPACGTRCQDDSCGSPSAWHICVHCRQPSGIRFTVSPSHGSPTRPHKPTSSSPQLPSHSNPPLCPHQLPLPHPHPHPQFNLKDSSHSALPSLSDRQSPPPAPSRHSRALLKHRRHISPYRNRSCHARHRSTSNRRLISSIQPDPDIAPPTGVWCLQTGCFTEASGLGSHRTIIRRHRRLSYGDPCYQARLRQFFAQRHDLRRQCQQQPCSHLCHHQQQQPSWHRDAGQSKTQMNDLIWLLPSTGPTLMGGDQMQPLFEPNKKIPKQTQWSHPPATPEGWLNSSQHESRPRVTGVSELSCTMKEACVSELEGADKKKRTPGVRISDNRSKLKGIKLLGDNAFTLSSCIKSCQPLQHCKLSFSRLAIFLQPFRS
ncbi:unnamed protein product [Protopolystoma xenopodis]|uniref:Uncharacterized protein n=1 Tax=Protopolystoma xenopodis TaxID=117903 RepID=A0A3S5B6T6_9PLAT|nr:unnamed protein product [Protopolystoma xenopodis]